MTDSNIKKSIPRCPDCKSRYVPIIQVEEHNIRFFGQDFPKQNQLRMCKHCMKQFWVIEELETPQEKTHGDTIDLSQVDDESNPDHDDDTDNIPVRDGRKKTKKPENFNPYI